MQDASAGIPLEEVNKMKQETFLGTNSSLYVSKTLLTHGLNYSSLVLAEEKDGDIWKKDSYA